jgi:hypothetical protein
MNTWGNRPSQPSPRERATARTRARASCRVFTKEGTGAPRVYTTVEGRGFGKRGLTLAGDPADGRGERLQLDAGVRGGAGGVHYSARLSRALLGAVERRAGRSYAEATRRARCA